MLLATASPYSLHRVVAETEIASRTTLRPIGQLEQVRTRVGQIRRLLLEIPSHHLCSHCASRLLSHDQPQAGIAWPWSHERSIAGSTYSRGGRTIDRASVPSLIRLLRRAGASKRNLAGKLSRARSAFSTVYGLGRCCGGTGQTAM